MKKCILIWLLNIMCINCTFASTPLWTFQPLTPTTVSITPYSIVNVDYLVTNQSSETHTIAIQPFPFEITKVDPLSCGSVFTLEPNKSCILNVLIKGFLVSDSFRGGPVLCEDGTQVLCYIPSKENILTVIFLGA